MKAALLVSKANGKIAEPVTCLQVDGYYFHSRLLNMCERLHISTMGELARQFKTFSVSRSVGPKLSDAVKKALEREGLKPN